MTTMAAIGRVVHHSVILDMMNVESYRALEATQRQQQQSLPETDEGVVEVVAGANHRVR